MPINKFVERLIRLQVHVQARWDGSRDKTSSPTQANAPVDKAIKSPR